MRNYIGSHQFLRRRLGLAGSGRGCRGLGVDMADILLIGHHHRPVASGWLELSQLIVITNL